MILRHFLNVIAVGLLLIRPSRSHDNAFHDLVVRFIFQYALVHPVVPIAAKIYITRQVLTNADLLWTVALKIIELRGPPSRVRRASEQFVHLLLPFLRILAGEKIFHFLRRRQRAGHIQSHPP